MNLPVTIGVRLDALPCQVIRRECQEVRPDPNTIPIILIFFEKEVHMMKLSQKEMMAVHGGGQIEGLENAQDHEQSPVMDIGADKAVFKLYINDELVHVFGT
jgi:hypothetical protein